MGRRMGDPWLREGIDRRMGDGQMGGRLDRWEGQIGWRIMVGERVEGVVAESMPRSVGRRMDGRVGGIVGC